MNELTDNLSELYTQLRLDGKVHNRQDFARFLGLNPVDLESFLNGKKSACEIQVWILASRLGIELFDLYRLRRPIPAVLDLFRHYYPQALGGKPGSEEETCSLIERCYAEYALAQAREALRRVRTQAQLDQLRSLTRFPKFDSRILGAWILGVESLFARDGKINFRLGEVKDARVQERMIELYDLLGLFNPRFEQVDLRRTFLIPFGYSLAAFLVSAFILLQKLQSPLVPWHPTWCFLLVFVISVGVCFLYDRIVVPRLDPFQNRRILKVAGDSLLITAVVLFAGVCLIR